ncbi:MAG: hypothetical protein IID33_03540, partial [Planctomycetes bacterium]|nr:hypothetical protein [Planctomycetota bacterium]
MLTWQLQFQSDVQPAYLLTALALVAVLMTVYALRLFTGDGPRQAVPCLLVAAGAALTVVAGIAQPAFRHPGWLTPIALLIFALVVFLSYRSVYLLGRRRMFSLVALRVASVALVLLLLVRPVISKPASSGPRPVVAVLLDASRSMGVRDIPNAPSRYARALSVLESVEPLISDTLRLECYAFDQSADAPASLRALRKRPVKGESTDLAGSISDVAGRAAQSDVRAIVVLSDGNHNAAADPLAAAAEAGPIVHTVVVGRALRDDQRPADVEIATVDAPREVAAGNVCTIRCTVAVFGMSRRTLQVRLLEGRREIARSELVISGADETLAVEFEYVPKETGRKTLTVRIPVDPAEVIPQNNRRSIHLLVTEPRIKVLYIEGAPRAEFKYLRRYLSRDPQVELATLVQTRIGNFQAGGSVGGRSMSGWPDTPEQIERFDVFLIGDVDRSYLSTRQLDLLHDAVAGGKGLIAIGGQAGFGAGGYGGSKLEDLLPVVVGGRTLVGGGSRQEPTPFVPQLTEDGRGHGIFSGIAQWLDVDAAAPRAGEKVLVPPLRGCVIVDAAKPGATVLARHPTRNGPDGRPLIVLAVQNFGSGRSAAFTADTTYLWYLARRVGAPDSLFHRFWGQMIRWLANAELKQQAGMPVRLRLQRVTYTPGERVRIQARVLSSEGQSEDFADVVATITGPDEQVESLRLERVAEEPGRYVATTVASLAGEHTVRATAAKNGKEVGSDELSF